MHAFCDVGVWLRWSCADARHHQAKWAIWLGGGNAVRQQEVQVLRGRVSGQYMMSPNRGTEAAVSFLSISCLRCHQMPGARKLLNRLLDFQA